MLIIPFTKQNSTYHSCSLGIYDSDRSFRVTFCMISRFLTSLCWHVGTPTTRFFFKNMYFYATHFFLIHKNLEIPCRIKIQKRYKTNPGFLDLSWLIFQGFVIQTFSRYPDSQYFQDSIRLTLSYSYILFDLLT